MNVTETGFEVLYEVGACLAVAKPGGLLTQAARGIDSLEVRIKEFLKARGERQGGVYLGMVHRLDRPVSGVLVMGTNRRAARRLAEQFEGRMVHKVYWALVEGQIDEDTGTWRDYLRKIPNVAQAEVVEENSPDAREAILKYQVIQRRDKLTWLQIQLETGRMHQIRVQAAARGCPVLGDEQYGAKRPFGKQFEDVRERLIGLHARELGFRQPKGWERILVEAPLPTPWHDLGITEDVAAATCKQLANQPGRWT
ncbi:MAG: RNA pseudouridine synthase [Pirellulaceae bacterium]|jgi:23S rRNA pseudouridine1911/1915/1917 synthase|nr:RNA pseudouridine synthase [Pirellulaceae bacterium]MDP6717681.1 RNA pseudouridine synthase [Pirellulaceae bacterium]